MGRSFPSSLLRVLLEPHPERREDAVVVLGRFAALRGGGGDESSSLDGREGGGFRDSVDGMSRAPRGGSW